MEIKTTKMNNNKKKVISALEKSLGIVSSACKSCGIARTSFYEWYKKDEVFKKAVDDVYQIAIDFAETSLYRQIKEGNTAATIFMLKCKGKERGWLERQQIELAGNLRLSLPDEEKEMYDAADTEKLEKVRKVLDD